ncbi:MAG: hypothetical protein DSM106950_08560 [Stigonema ocellatum SAG 48.90 = DSM 106950]|nr:hypothetical protein [Stigonema ocellatum SAG 48.90 = DSM 106950]
MSKSIATTTTANTPDIESVKVTLTGSPKAITKVIHSLYGLRFSEVNDWSRPQPTQNPNEAISILIRRVSLD